MIKIGDSMPAPNIVATFRYKGSIFTIFTYRKITMREAEKIILNWAKYKGYKTIPKGHAFEIRSLVGIV